MNRVPTITNTSDSNEKKVPIQERSILVRDIIVVNGFGTNRSLLNQRFAEGAYLAQETPHFSAYTRSEPPTTILVHYFAPEEINADVKHFVMLELKPLGLLTQSYRYGEILAGIVGSFFPEDVRRAWRYYGANTLQRFLIFLSTVSTPPYPDYTNIGSFVTQYQRICELCVGTTFLDAGCESGFLPLLIAERMPFMKRVMGVDIRTDMFSVVEELAQERNLHQVHFAQANLLAENFCTFGQFDTVVALGVVEHFTEEEMYRVLTHLLKITMRRLILTVPYEQEPEAVYEHKQVFTPAKLRTVGEWCLHHINDVGQMWCEECVGGLLLIERPESNPFA
jgi:2-polyprenyl-3-methyl-5-hydroxy-6-metoxy-1,4-benzoquinol methylase